MNRKIITAMLLGCALLTGCGQSAADVSETVSEETVSESAREESEDEEAEETEETAEDEAEAAPLEDGVYTADFDTDSSMFHVSEACDGKGTLTVENGEMTIHISLASKNILNLYPGLAEDAQKEGAVLLEPTVDSVTYSDGITEEVHGFDVPVPALDEEFDLALVGTKGTWYDHKVSVSNPERVSVMPEDGTYTVEVTLEGGSGRAQVTSPAVLVVENGAACAQIEWSSSHYDYMKIGEETYLPVNEEGNSVFEIPVAAFDEQLPVIADTTAMSTPHEVEYTLTFSSASITPASCGTADSSGNPQTETAVQSQPVDELAYEGSMELLYAECFSVDYYEGGLALITVNDSDRYLLVPEEGECPGNLDGDITVLYQPLDQIYLVASAVMDMFLSMDALEDIRFTGTKAESWYLPEAREAVEAGELLYAGNYAAPDYERIVAEGCDLAIENTMVYHTPEVVEQLESFGIPVIVDYSSYEAEPLGRTEWVKLYGLLTGRLEEAEAAFAAQQGAFAAIDGAEDTGKTVAFFYITSNGEVNVRRSSDYLPKMIELAGGQYVFSDLGNEEETASSTVTLQMEEFYAQAREADFLIYNSTVDGELSSVEDMLGKSELLENFKAVREGQVYCTTRNLYQSSMELGTMIADIHAMLRGEEESLTYLYRLE